MLLIYDVCCHYIGEVELENLPLRKDALRHVGLPIQVCAGYIGKLKLQIPVPQIRSAPWVIFIEQLCLVTGPVKLTEVRTSQCCQLMSCC
jgi:vacuolar protein sorting-associated protein 13D